MHALTPCSPRVRGFLANPEIPEVQNRKGTEGGLRFSLLNPGELEIN